MVELAFDYEPVTSQEFAANIKHGFGNEPEIVRLQRDEDLRWSVTEILDTQEAPAPDVLTRYRLRVLGPLPGGPWEAGEFVMVATHYRGRPYWWIRPEGPDE